MQISNLPASNSFSSTDVLPIEINGVTYKVTGATLAAALQTLGNYLTPDNVANNLTTTAAGSVLDARQGKVLNDKINATQSDIAIIIEGNQTTHTGGVAVGEYVIVRNSTISGITNGLYKAVQAIPANTAIDSTYLEVVDGGGLNELNSKSTWIYIDTKSNTDKINYPADAKELYIAIGYSAANNPLYCATIPTNSGSGNTSYKNGYYKASNDNGFTWFHVDFTNRQVWKEQTIYDGSTTTGGVSVYYRK